MDDEQKFISTLRVVGDSKVSTIGWPVFLVMGCSSMTGSRAGYTTSEGVRELHRQHGCQRGRSGRPPNVVDET